MKLGIFSVADHYPMQSARSLRQLYQELLEQSQAADELGFHSFWVAEHHFHEYGSVPRPAIWLSSAAQLTKRIKLGSAVVVLPFDNPVRVAEDFAMVDVLSNGRLVLGVGSGYLAHEYAGFGIDPDQRRDRFDEALAILLEAWKGRRFSFHGRYFKFDNVQLNVVPIQEPTPPISIAILREEAAKFVAQQQLSIMMIPYATTENVEDLSPVVKGYKQEFIERDGTGGSGEVRFAIHAHCAVSEREAIDVARDAMDRYVSSRLYAKQRSFQSLASRGLIGIGQPEEVLRVARIYQAMGTTELLLIANFGALPHKKVLRSLELIADAVLPALSSERPLVVSD